MTTAFTVHGYQITTEQRDAGLAAMAGEFCKDGIAFELSQAGVPWMGFIGDVGNSRIVYACKVAADRLMQSERKAGRIKCVGRGWVRV